MSLLPLGNRGRRGGGSSGITSLQDIPDLYALYDASDATTVIASAGAVSQWNDKSGNGRHATQGTALNKPVTGTRTIGGRNALDFDGTNSFLTLPASYYTLPTGDHTVICVTSLDVSGSDQNIISLSDAGNGRMRLLVNSSTNPNAAGASNSTNTVLSVLNNTATVNAPRISVLTRKAGTVVVNQDGEFGLPAVGVNFTATAARIGSFTVGTQFFNGALGLLAVYSRALTQVEINAAANFLKAQWAAPWTNVITVPSLLSNRATAVYFGDSITFGQGASKTYLDWQRTTAASMRVINTNQGIQGTVLQNSNLGTGSPQVNNGRDRYVAALTGAAKRDVCFINYGFNDLRYTGGGDMSLANFIIDYQEILTGLLGAGYAATDIVIGSPYWISDFGYTQGTAGFTGSNRTVHESYVAACRALAVTNGTLYADVYAAMRDGGGESLISGDYIHPNDAGYRVISQAMMAATVVY